MFWTQGRYDPWILSNSLKVIECVCLWRHIKPHYGSESPSSFFCSLIPYQILLLFSFTSFLTVCEVALF